MKLAVAVADQFHFQLCAQRESVTPGLPGHGTPKEPNPTLKVATPGPSSKQAQVLKYVATNFYHFKRVGHAWIFINTVYSQHSPQNNHKYLTWLPWVTLSLLQLQKTAAAAAAAAAAGTTAPPAVPSQSQSQHGQPRLSQPQQPQSKAE